uniref:VPS37 C-terminal domain-containing protein n=2 Tax=Clastoptera arizonana TaxID=38151 RepID=A0A1B6C8J3_9HEMI
MNSLASVKCKVVKMLSNFYTSNDSLAIKRKKQIDTLKVFNANVSEITEDSEYKVEFESGTNQLSLIIILKPEFPMEKPILKVVPLIKHHWIGEGGDITGAPGLLNFTEHSDLGRVVRAIVREFELRPPQIINGTSPPSINRVDTNNYTYSSTPPGTAPAFMNYRDYGTTIPSHPQPKSITFPELNTLSKSDLELLNADIDRLDEFVTSLPAIKELNRSIEERMVENEELAKENLLKEPQLVKLKEIYQEKLVTLGQLKSRHETLSAEYQRLADRYSPQSIRVSVQKLWQLVMLSDKFVRPIITHCSLYISSFLLNKLDYSVSPRNFF